MQKRLFARFLFLCALVWMATGRFALAQINFPIASVGSSSASTYNYQITLNDGTTIPFSFTIGRKDKGDDR